MIYDIEVTKQEIDNAMLMPGEYRRVGDKYYIPRGMLDGYDASPLPSPTPPSVELGPELREGVVMNVLPANPDFVEIVTAMKMENRVRCHDCGILEGELHDPNCDMEKCPFCSCQLISCDCCYELLGIDCSPGTWAYEHGLTEEQGREWLVLLGQKGRIPWIQYPVLCAKCGRLWPEFFSVPDEEWRHYVQPNMRGEVLCRRCYDFIKDVIDITVKED